MVSLSSSTSTATAFILFIATWSASIPFFFAIFQLVPSLAHTAHAAGADEWRSRSIYQIITDRFARADGSTDYPCSTADQLYCGGSFQGIIKQLDYIQGMGFTALWISPVIENIPDKTAYGQGYHGFWSHNIMNINPHFGTSDDLKALSAELHRRGMFLMIDVVINNVASAGPGATTDYASFPPPFNDEKYFHPFKFITNYDIPEQVENQWLGDNTVALPDLDTELPYVQDVWHTWISQMVANYSLDGLRIDAAKHVDKPFWPGFQAAAGVFTMGEVFNLDKDPPNVTCDWAVDALSSVLNYPVWYSIYGVIANSSQPMGGLGYKVNLVAAGCHDVTLLGTFSENHDVARFGSYTSDLSQQKNALTFNVMTDGIPVVYYGAEQRFTGQNDPSNREALWLNPTGYDTTAPLYQHIRSLNIVRTAVGQALAGDDYSNWSGFWAYKAKILYSNDDVLVFRKGYDTSIITALTNGGVGSPPIGPYHMGDTNLVQGVTIVEVLSCTSMKTGLYGEFDITLTNGEPQVWVPARYLHTVDGLCPDLLKELNRTGATTEKASSATTLSSPFSSPMSLIGSLAFALCISILFGL